MDCWELLRERVDCFRSAWEEGCLMDLVDCLMGTSWILEGLRTEALLWVLK